MINGETESVSKMARDSGNWKKWVIDLNVVITESENIAMFHLRKVLGFTCNSKMVGT